MKKKIISAVSATMLLSGSFVGSYEVFGANNVDKKEESVILSNVSFNDVHKDHYAYKSITYLANKGIVKGYGNGLYGIKDDVTRGQVSALIARYLELDTDKEYSNPFSDVKGDMFEKEILAVADAGFMQGKGKGKFDPKATLTRAEMAQVLTNVFDLKVKKKYDFHDMDKNHWGLDAVRALYSNGLTLGTGNYKFDPSGKVTRGQYAEFLYRGIHLDDDFEAEPIPPKPEPEKPNPNKPQIEIDKEKEGFTFTDAVKEGSPFPLSPAHPETQKWVDQFVRDLKIEGNKVTGKIPEYDDEKYTVNLQISERNDDNRVIEWEVLFKKSLTNNYSGQNFNYNINQKYPNAQLSFTFYEKKRC